MEIPPNHRSVEPERDERVRKHWDSLSDIRLKSNELKLVAWAEHPLVARHINLMVSGDSETYWVRWALESFFEKRPAVGLSIGCGSGYIERYIIDNDLASGMCGIDISRESIERAKRLAGLRPIEYRVLDLNTDELQENTYDFCISAAALHHIANLEHCIFQVWKSLKSGGKIIANEYVGAERFQWSPKQLALANRIYSLLPDRYKYNFLTKQTERAVKCKPVWDVISVDPSEAVRSSEILQVVSEFFEIAAKRDYGGYILHPLLEGIIGNFDHENSLDIMVLRMLAALEEGLMKTDQISSDFTVIVCSRKDVIPNAEALVARGFEKMDMIERQEREILELNRRLEEADVHNRRLSEAVERKSQELRRLMGELEELRKENEALKSSFPVNIIRLAHLKLRRSRRYP